MKTPRPTLLILCFIFFWFFKSSIVESAPPSEAEKEAFTLQIKAKENFTLPEWLNEETVNSKIDKFTPIMIASFHGNKEIAEALLQFKSIDLSIRTHPNEFIALIHAAMTGNHEILELLIKHTGKAPNVNYKNRNGVTAYALALKALGSVSSQEETNKFRKTLKVLKKYGANTDQRTSYVQTAMLKKDFKISEGGVCYGIGWSAIDAALQEAEAVSSVDHFIQEMGEIEKIFLSREHFSAPQVEDFSSETEELLKKIAIFYGNTKELKRKIKIDNSITSLNQNWKRSYKELRGFPQEKSLDDLISYETGYILSNTGEDNFHLKGIQSLLEWAIKTESPFGISLINNNHMTALVKGKSGLYFINHDHITLIEKANIASAQLVYNAIGGFEVIQATLVFPEGTRIPTTRLSQFMFLPESLHSMIDVASQEKEDQERILLKSLFLSTESDPFEFVHEFSDHPLSEKVIKEAPTKDIPDPFLQAVKREDPRILQLYLPKVGKAQLANTREKSPFYTAATNGLTRNAKMLLEQDAAIEESIKEMALLESAKRGHFETVEFLLSEEANANVNAQASDGATALLLAAQNGHIETVTILLKYKADPNISENTASTTALIQASLMGRLKIVQVLLDSKAKVNATDKYGEAALMKAVGLKRKIVVQLLLDKGADVNQVNEKGATPLYLAAEINSPDILTALLEKKEADPDISNDNNFTPLMIASQEGYEEVVKILIDHNANLDLQDITGATALIVALRTEHKEIAKRLIDAGTNLNLQTQEGTSSLILAILKNQYDIIEYLLKAGADLKILDANEYSPLHISAEKGEFRSTDLLLQEYKANIDAHNKFKMTPLCIASVGGHFEVGKTLLENGADIFKPCQDDLSPLHAAVFGGSLELFKLLVEKIKEKTTTKEEFLEKMTQVSANAQGVTPVLIASIYQKTSLLEALLEELKENPTAINKAAGPMAIDPNTQENFSGKTPLEIAQEKGFLDIEELLKKFTKTEE